MVRRSAAARAWRQLPFFIWLVMLWMLLWGQFTVLAAITGIVVALIVTRVFRLPPVELSGRLHPWHALVFVVMFAFAVVRGSLSVAWIVLDARRQPRNAVIAVPLRVDDDLIMTHTAITSSLIPGSLLIDIDRDRRVLYLHVIGVRSAEDIERQRRTVLAWERRVVQAFGSRAQVKTVTDAAAGGAS